MNSEKICQSLVWTGCAVAIFWCGFNVGEIEEFQDEHQTIRANAMNLLSLFRSHKPDVDAGSSVSPFATPFVKDKVKEVTFEVGAETSVFRDGKHVKAVIRFSNGKSDGRHEICVDTLEEAIAECRRFVESLP